jgi:hypothetical protein
MPPAKEGRGEEGMLNLLAAAQRRGGFFISRKGWKKGNLKFKVLDLFKLCFLSSLCGLKNFSP